MRIQYISKAAGGGRGRERLTESDSEPRRDAAAAGLSGSQGSGRAAPTRLGGPKRHPHQPPAVWATWGWVRGTVLVGLGWLQVLLGYAGGVGGTDMRGEGWELTNPLQEGN